MVRNLAQVQHASRLIAISRPISAHSCLWTGGVKNWSRLRIRIPQEGSEPVLANANARVDRSGGPLTVRRAAEKQALFRGTTGRGLEILIW